MAKPDTIALSAASAAASPTAPRLICFPHAGGAADRYQPWVERLAPQIEVRTVTLPGRGGLQGQAPFTAWGALVDAVAAGIQPLTDRPFAVFGHSFGAPLAYETARALAAKGHPPAILVVAGPAPQSQGGGPVRSTLPRAELLAEIKAIDGTPDDVLANPEVMDRLLPALRADFALLERYDGTAAARHPPLPCPILALGADDDPQVPLGTILAWRHRTAARFDSRLFSGGHFFQFTNPALPTAISDHLDGPLHEYRTDFEHAG